MSTGTPLPHTPPGQGGIRPGPETRRLALLMVVVVVLSALIYILAPYPQDTATEEQRALALRFVAFFGLVITHGLLYAFGPRIRRDGRLLRPYFLTQALLVFAIGLVTGGSPIVLLLYAAAISEAVVVVGGVPQVVGLAAVVAVLFSINQLLFQGARNALNTLFALATIGILVYVITYVRGALATKRIGHLVRELDDTNRELAQYAREVEGLARTEERQRMARELHDTLAQGLVGVTLQLEAADSHLSHERPQRARQIVGEALQRGRETLAEARRAIYDLREDRDDVHDLERSVRDEAGRFTAATDLPCRVVFMVNEPVGASLVLDAVRAIREALTNVLRHAKASAVTLTVSDAGHHLELTVRDDGVGFNPDDVPVGHYGLLGLRERARTRGGSVEIESDAGKGTTLRIQLPHSSTRETA